MLQFPREPGSRPIFEWIQRALQKRFGARPSPGKGAMMVDKGVVSPNRALGRRPEPRSWFRDFAFLRPRWEAVVLLLGLAVFWGGVILKLLT